MRTRKGYYEEGREFGNKVSLLHAARRVRLTRRPTKFNRWSLSNFA